jgi:hypothetical protein
MLRAPKASLVVASHFIEATRDSGYKSLGSALAELIDNAFEAKATAVHVVMGRGDETDNSESIVSVSDNGRGMDTETCRNALRFGWSSRFNQRDSHGRYGMGLPNASLSHARRVEVVSSANGRSAALSYLDADDISAGRRDTIPEAQPLPLVEYRSIHPFQRGTSVIWRKCDRLEKRYLGPLTKRLRAELGRLFRYQLWSGKRITVNEERVVAVDPLFERAGGGLVGAQNFGPELSYEIAQGEARPTSSVVRVRFTELPVGEWHSMSNAQKNAAGIAKGAGVSIVRAGREIDCGWFFMGQKRRENYDDWWRCEVRFEPEMDELFGVTHTKQDIHPTEKLVGILTPDMEKIARELNGRARQAFVEVKAKDHQRDSEKVAERFDNLIEPPPHAVMTAQKSRGRLRRGGRGRVGGLEYRFCVKKADAPWFFTPELNGGRLTVALNGQHPFVRKACGKMLDGSDGAELASDKNLELLILAAARSEVMLAKDKRASKWAQQFRELWSNILATFLS